MKFSQDPRHLQRIKLVQQLFAQSFTPQKKQKMKTRLILKHLDKIDSLIKKSAPLWPIDKIFRIDLSILRLAVYELVIDKKQPAKVIIDEAVEIAKLLGKESSPSFVNGVLGTILKL